MPEEIAVDPLLLETSSRDIAREALGEITDPKSIGSDDGHEVFDERTVTLFFECRLPGYPGWRWAAALARVDADSPVTVLEVELLPGEGAVLAPEWVPWSVRLAQYREAQSRQAADEAAAAEEAAEELADVDDIDPDDDLMENDFSDFDDELDGVDVDGEDVESEDDDDDFEDIDDDDDDDSDDDDDDSDGDSDDPDDEE